LLIAALVLLLAGCWPPVRGWSWTWPWTWSRRPRLKSVGASLLLIAVAGLAAGAGDAPPLIRPESASEAVARGQAAYDAGSLDEATAAFEVGIPRAEIGGPVIQRRRHALSARAACRGPPALSRGPPASWRFVADQDRLCPGQHGAGPGPHTRGHQLIRRMSRLDRGGHGPRRRPA